MSKLSVRIAEKPAEAEEFWRELNAYFERDIFPEGGEDLEEFQSAEYRETIGRLRARETDPLYFLFFEREGRTIGFAMPVIFGSEDGKCFIMEFGVYPEFRGNGTGSACAQALMKWAQERNAAYFELNAAREDRQRFWERLGFTLNGLDEWGEPLLLSPPREDLPIEVLPLEQADLWQLYHLENSYKAEIGEAPLTDGDKERLAAALERGEIIFFAARRLSRCVGLCSASTLFSTYGCKTMAVFEDFYVEPAWRHKGTARLLTEAAQKWCGERGISSLWVGCANCDVPMYQDLGFDVPLGDLLTWAGD